MADSDGTDAGPWPDGGSVTTRAGAGRGDADAGGCALCDLPTGEDPVTDPDVDGEFCCQGCLAVAHHLGTEAGADGVDGADRTDSADAAGQRSAVDPDEVLDSGPDPDEVAGADAEGTAETFLAVDGMHCSTCEAFLETRATGHGGVRAAEASYASDLLRVVHEEDVDAGTLVDAVSGTGYEAREVADAGDADPTPRRRERVGRLIVGGFFGMLVMLWYVLFLYPAYLGVDSSALLLDVHGGAGRYLLGNIWVMTTVVLGYTGYPILRGAYVSLRTGEPNMDLLVALAAVTAYAYSTLAVLVGHTEVYFDVSVVIVLAVTIGGYYERRVKAGATERLTELTTERVDSARVRTAEGTERRPLENVEAGEEVLVREGERVPLDGAVREGEAAVDEALVTGESTPVRATPGDEVVGGAEVTDGGLVVEVGERERNTVDRIARRLWQLQTGRRGVQRLADRLAGVFVPLVVAVAVLATVAHLATGVGATAALLTGLAVLVVSCPCALGLATPLSVAAGVRDALAEGIVITDESTFERATDADVVAVDKTGTLTTGELELERRSGEWAVDDDLLAEAAALEQFADHPLAAAVVEAAPERDLQVTDLDHRPGLGVAGTVSGREVVVGHPDLFDERGWDVPPDLREAFEGARASGAVAALVGREGAAEGLIAAVDRLREGAEDVLADLSAGREVVLITGDEGAAAERFRDHPAVAQVFAGVPPEAKAEVVKRLRERGTVAMVGDGSNDAPALAAADVGIAVADGTELAVDAADAVVTTDDLRAVPRVFAVTAGTRRRVRENVGWALGYNAVAVPAAALGLLNPLVAAVAMASSSLLVVTNAARPVVSD